MAYSFNGSTVTFPTTATTDRLGTMTDMNLKDSAAKIQVTVANGSKHTYEAGLPDAEITIDIMGSGATAVTIGATGILTLNWNSGQTNTYSNAVCVERSISGGIDSPVKTTLTFAPAP